MIGPIVRDVQFGLAVEAALEAGNDIVVKPPARPVYGAGTYNTISHSAALTLALVLSRLFDPGSRWRHADEKDTNSIPILLHYLAQQRCRGLLGNRARTWVTGMPHMADSQQAACLQHIDRAIDAYKTLNLSPKGRLAKRRLREFRNKILAHNLRTPMETGHPRFGELFLLMKAAAQIVGSADFAIRGSNRDLGEYAENRRGEADEFWTHALTGLMQER